MKFRAVGDSHCLIFSNIEECKINFIRGKTMFGSRKQEIVELKKWGCQDDEYVIYVFGEIDVRCHIGRIRDTQNKTLEDIIEDLVLNYFDMISKQPGIPIVTLVIPPSDKNPSSSHPYHGTIADRVSIQKKLNIRLEEECKKRNIICFDYNKNFTLPDGSLDHSHSDGIVHIDHKYANLIFDDLKKLLVTTNTSRVNTNRSNEKI